MTAEEYFQSIAEEIFAKTLNQFGAGKVSSGPLVVRFENDGWFVELLALSEDGPLYSPRVEIGPLPERGALARDKQVDIMHTVPADSPLRRYNLEWRYSGPAEMRQVYTRVRDGIFTPYAIPVLLDHERLTRLVASRSQQLQKQWRDETTAHNDAVYRAKAQAVIATKDYEAFIDQMKNIPEERQTEIERTRVHYAMQQVRK